MPSSTSSSDTSRAKRALIALIAVFVLLNAGALAVWQAMPFSPVSEGRYLAAVDDHLSMLAASKGEEGRVILLGGSGVAFSISAETLGEELGRPVYNGGIQASIGIRNLIDLYAPHLDPQNDLIVLVPELELIADDARYTATWCDVVFLRKDFGALAARPRCVPHILHRSYQEVRHHMTGNTASDPVYRRSGFNAVGDLTSHLSRNPGEPDFSGYTFPDVTEAKLAQFEDYIRGTLIERGFEVLYVPPAAPETACQIAPKRMQSMIDRLAKLSTGNPPEYGSNDYCLPPEMFFDLAGHLNREGREGQTERVRRALADFGAR